MDVMKLPLLNASQSIRDAIDRMKEADRHAIVVSDAPKSFRIVLNRSVQAGYRSGIQRIGDIEESYRTVAPLELPKRESNILMTEFDRPAIGGRLYLPPLADVMRLVQFHGADFAIAPFAPEAVVVSRSEKFIVEINQAQKVCICNNNHVNDSAADGQTCFCGGTYECF